MRSKTPLVLMEQLVMVLVFALAAALCVQAFTLADRRSRQVEAMDCALLEAQNAVETLKSCGGDYRETAELCRGTWDGAELCRFNNKDWKREQEGNAAYVLTVTPAKSEDALLGRAEVAVTDRSGELLCALPAAWQEVDGHA